MRNKIAAIGTINKDTIYTPRGKKHESYGGLLYTIIPLAQMLGNNFEILPILNLGRDCRRPVMTFIQQYPNIKHDYINVVSYKNNDCRLFYSDRETKNEILKGGVPRLTFNDIKPVLGCGLTIINFISGRDVSLPSLEKFRADYRGQIYLDIHSLTLGKRATGERYLRKPANWKRFCACADYLQVNRQEFELLYHEKLTHDSMRDFFKEFENGFLKALHITLGKKGSYLVYKPKSRILVKGINAPLVKKPLDTTGCGDVFGAAFVSAVIKGASIYAASRSANIQAARKSRYAGIEGLMLHGPKSTHGRNFLLP